jgi:hypothetical protein
MIVLDVSIERTGFHKAVDIEGCIFKFSSIFKII